MTALEVRPVMAVPDKIRYAQALADSGLLPQQYRRQPANLLYAIEYAEMIGAHPLAAVTGIFVIDGKPSASAGLISALVRRAGHKLRVTGDATKATAQIIRADDPDFTFEVTFTMDDAKAAGLAGKNVWKQYPASMLKARAITQVARDACEDALSGLHYTAEELGAEVNEDGVPLTAEAEHRALVGEVLESEPAERQGRKKKSDPTPPPVDEWSTTDPKWLAEWREGLADATNDDVIDALGADLLAAIATGQVVQADVEMLKAEGKARREQLKTEPGPGQVDMLTGEVVEPPADGWPEVKQPPDAEDAA